ncbi:MAG: helix-turn-helix transcriptional regulator [Thermoguttaceae bacterium]
MAKNAASKKLERLFSLLRHLRAGWCTLEMLSVELGTSTRTVFRYLRELNTLGFSIKRIRKYQCYRIRSEVILPNTQFDLEETLALITLCNETSETKQIPFLYAAHRAAVKLKTNLPGRLQDEIDRIGRALEVIPCPYNPLTGVRSTYDAVLDAQQREYSLRIWYKSPVEPEFITLLSPYKLLFSRRSWYVLGRSSLHRETRIFHVGRIIKYEITDEKFSVPRGFSSKQFFRNAWHIIPEHGKDSEVVVRFSPLVAQNVSEVIWHPKQKVLVREDGAIDFNVTVSGLNEISWWILGYGKEAEVLKPLKLRAMIKEHAEAMSQMYKND